MEKILFDTIKDTWESTANEAHNAFCNAASNEYLESMSVKDLRDLIKYSRQFCAYMENLFCDFRHLLGMSELSASERGILTKLFTSITQYRPIAKRISAIRELDFSIKENISSNYELKTVANIVLQKDLSSGECRSRSTLLAGSRVERVSDEEIKVRISKYNLVNDIIDFFNVLNPNGAPPTMVTEEQITKQENKLKSGLYCGQKVSSDSENYYIHFIADNSTVYARFSALC